jgi:hypothetical protein
LFDHAFVKNLGTTYGEDMNGVDGRRQGKGWGGLGWWKTLAATAAGKPILGC